MNEQRPLRRQLRELAELEPDAEASRRAIAAARAVLRQSDVRQTPSARSLPMFPRRALLAAAATIVVAAGVALLFNGDRGNMTFAQVVAQVERAKTVQYVETHAVSARGQQGPTTTAKVMTLGRSQLRKEYLSATPGDPLEGGARWTQSPIGVISIVDWTAGKSVTLNPANRTFTEHKVVHSLGDEGNLRTTAVVPDAQVDFYRQMQSVPADKAERLPAQEIAGKSAVGFRTVEVIQGEHGEDAWTRTYWVDPTTYLPLRIETNFTSTNPLMGQSRWVQSDIVFDAPLDESLFSTDPPEGYALSP